MEKIDTQILGLLFWRKFKNTDALLFIINDIGVDASKDTQNQIDCFREYLIHTFSKVDIKTPDEIVHDKKYDCIIDFRGIENVQNPDKYLLVLKEMLKEKGQLLIFTENRYGIQYLCGKRDPYTNLMYDSVCGYSRPSHKTSRLYSKKELKSILSEANITDYSFYSIKPGLYNPEIISADDYRGKELEYFNRKENKCNSDDTSIFLRNNIIDLFNDIEEYHYIADAFLIAVCEEKSSDKFIKIQQYDNVYADAFITSICVEEKNNKKTVRKYFETEKMAEEYAAQIEILQNRCIGVVGGCQKLNTYTMQYIDAELLYDFLKKQVREDKKQYFRYCDKLISQLYKLSDICLINGKKYFDQYYDLSTTNCFIKNDDFIFIDLYRGKTKISENDALISVIKSFPLAIDISLDDLYKRYGLEENRKEQKADSDIFTITEDNIDYKIVANRKLIEAGISDISQFDVKSVLNKPVIVYGSGDFANGFFDKFGGQSKIVFVADSNPKKWGQVFRGCEIKNPEEIRKTANCTVVICIDVYSNVLTSLKGMGIKDIKIFDPVLSVT